MAQMAKTKVSEVEARRVHDDAIVVDAEQSSAYVLPAPVVNGKDFLQRTIDGGTTAVVQTLAAGNTNFRGALARINEYYQLLDVEPKRTKLVRSSNDIVAAKRERKLGLIFGFQDATPLEDDWKNLLPVCWRLGVRVIQLTYNEHNRLGSGCLESNDLGLTAYGQQVVGAMNRLGVMLNLSHTGEKTSLEAIEASQDPCIITHANPKKLTPHPRNKSDVLIKALAAKGGVIGVVAWSPLAVLKPGIAPTVDDLVTHIDYIVNLVGIDHVAIGTDINEPFRVMPIPSSFETQYSFQLAGFKGRAPALEGFSSVDEFPNVTRALLERGYKEADVKKVLGGNFVRLTKTVWDKHLPE